jgi:hypothetical protein
MASVYQRLAGRPRRALRGWVAGALLLGCAGCGTGSGSPPDVPRPARTWPLDVFLACRSYRAEDVDDRGRLLATETDSRGPRAIRLRPEGGIDPVAGGGSARALAALDGGEWLALESPASASTPRRIFLATGAGAVLPLTGSGDDRYVGRSADGRRLWTARTGAGGTESLIETVPPSPVGRPLLDAPAGFRVAAVSGDGVQVALVRAIAPGADEVVWADRATGQRRLVLPTGPDGRFQPQLFSDDGRRLLFVADDASDLPRLEWLDLASGRRELPLETPCAAVAARRLGGEILADLACDGRRRTLPLEGEAPWEGRLPPELVAVAAAPASGGSWWLTLAGPRAARDLALFPRDRLVQPFTWGLEPRLQPEDLVAPDARRFRSADVEVPAELWRPRGRSLAAVIWLESDAAPPRWGEFHPFFAFLASRGFTVLRFRPRGSRGFGRSFRSAGEQDPVAAALADARAALRSLGGSDSDPVALVGAGARADECGADGSPPPPFVACLPAPDAPDAAAFRGLWAQLESRVAAAR